MSKSPSPTSPLASPHNLHPQLQQLCCVLTNSCPPPSLQMSWALHYNFYVSSRDHLTGLHRKSLYLLSRLPSPKPNIYIQLKAQS